MTSAYLVILAVLGSLSPVTIWCAGSNSVNISEEEGTWTTLFSNEVVQQVMDTVLVVKDGGSVSVRSAQHTARFITDYFMVEWRKKFKSYDINNNGKLSEKEFVNLILQTLEDWFDLQVHTEIGVRNNIRTFVFLVMDTDKDKQLTEEESITWINNLGLAMVSSARQLDVSNDERISYDDMKIHYLEFQQLKQLVGFQVMAQFGKIGTLHYRNELSNIIKGTDEKLKKLFQEMDRDHDRFLSQTEVEFSALVAGFNAHLNDQMRTILLLTNNLPVHQLGNFQDVQFLEDGLQILFLMLDKDRDAVLSLDEFKQLNQVEWFLGILDKNNDGAISATDFALHISLSEEEITKWANNTIEAYRAYRAPTLLQTVRLKFVVWIRQFSTGWIVKVLLFTVVVAVILASLLKNHTNRRVNPQYRVRGNVAVPRGQIPAQPHGEQRPQNNPEQPVATHRANSAANQPDVPNTYLQPYSQSKTEDVIKDPPQEELLQNLTQSHAKDTVQSPQKDSTVPAKLDKLKSSRQKQKIAEAKVKPSDVILREVKKPAPQEEMVKALTSVLNIEVRLSESRFTEWQPEIMTVLLSDLPPLTHIPANKEQLAKEQLSMIAHRTAVLLEKRVAREPQRRISLASGCWSRSKELLKEQRDHLTAITIVTLEQLLLAAKNSIVTSLSEGSFIPDEEDIWASFQSKATRMPEAAQLLECISGWDADAMSPELLAELLADTQHCSQGHRMWVRVIQSVGYLLKMDKKWDEHHYKYGNVITGLERLLKTTNMRPFLVERLKYEINTAADGLGSFFEGESIFGPLLAVTSIPTCVVEGVDPRAPDAKIWLEMKDFPKLRAIDVRMLEENIRKSRSQMTHAIGAGLKQIFRTNSHVAATWLSHLVALNELRTTVSARVQLSDAQQTLAASDGFMVNVCTVLLSLCRPLTGLLDKVAKLDPTYPLSQHCSLNYSQETCLAGGQIVCETQSESDSSEPPKKDYNFMTEIFHITLRAMNVGFMPALLQYKKQLSVVSANVTLAEETGGSIAEQMKRQHMLFVLRWQAHLLDADLLENGSRFYLTVCLWIKHLLQQAVKESDTLEAKSRAEQLVLQQVPEFVVKDMAHWFTFIASHGLAVHHDILSGVQLNDFVECAVLLLSRRDLMPGPIPAAALCQALLAFHTKSPTQSSRHGWQTGVISNLEVLIHCCEAVKTDLGPSLVHTYISVDVVEGLDVDKDEFDKYTARSEIGHLITRLWDRVDCRDSILQMCGTEKFQQFLGAIFDTLLYQLHDSLARLANVRKLEKAKDDEATWNAQSPKEQQEKKQFLRNEERVAKGFMRMATETLNLLDLLTKTDEITSCFTVNPLAKRAASAFIGFLEALCGTRSSELKVKDMKKYNWEPRTLLMQLSALVTRIVRQEESSGQATFTLSLSTDPDYNPATMARAQQILEERTYAAEDTVTSFKDLTELLSDVYAVYQSDMATSDEAEKLSSWKDDIIKITVDEEALEKAYTAALSHHRFDVCPMLESHAFAANATSQSIDPRSQRCRLLMKETRQWMDSLPIHPHATIFLRQDEERMDLVRALLTGPHDTPYSLGCFTFDIYFPPNYPNIPPLVKLITTGGGTVRFNPNLYADGKVCLSLLGTWHGGDATQKWQPGKSSLYQVLVSIQSMILISDPMYNEPGYEGIRGTSEGDARSSQYNANIRLMTLRHAVLSQITSPPKGFEKIIHRHYFHNKDVLRKQCVDWLHETSDPEIARRLSRVIDDLYARLVHLDDVPSDDEEEEEEEEDC